MAGDVYTAPPFVGRGGWSWYTGAAAWMYRAAVEAILGLRAPSRRRGRQRRGFPRTGRWRRSPIATARSRYTFVCTTRRRARRRRASALHAAGEAIALVDDGRAHRLRIRPWPRPWRHRRRRRRWLEPRTGAAGRRRFASPHDLGIRLRRRRRRLGRLRARQPADRGRPRTACCCSRPARPTATRGSTSRSGTRRRCSTRSTTGASTPSREPHMNGREVYWPRGRTLGGSLVDQRPHLHPRPARGLRRLGGARQPRLVARRRAAVVPQARAQRARRERVPRRRRSAVGVRHRRRRTRWSKRSSASASELGIPRNDDFNGATPGRRRLLPADHAQRHALLDGDRVPEAGARSRRTSTSRPSAHGDARAVRRPPRASASTTGRRRATRDGPRGARSDPRRRRAAVAAAAASCPASARRRCCSDSAFRVVHRAARRRREPAGPPAGARDLPLHAPITTNDTLRTWHGKLGIGARVRRAAAAVRWRSASTRAACSRARADGSARPDVQFHFATLSSDMAGSPVHAFPGFTMSVCQLRPDVARARAPRRRPIRSLRRRCSRTTSTRAEDRATLVAGMRLARRLAATRAARTATSPANTVPGADARDDDELLEFAQDTGGTIFHPSGTTKMGPAADPTRRRRRRAARARLASAARRRLRHHADARVGQHQRAGRDDRREGRRPHPARRALIAAATPIRRHHELLPRRFRADREKRPRASRWGCRRSRSARGVLAEAGDNARELGLRRVALFTDASACRRRARRQGQGVARGRGRRRASSTTRCAIEPTDASLQARRALRRAKRGVDGYVSVGGGSVIDTCKAANLYATHPARVHDVRQRADRRRPARPRAAEAAHRVPDDVGHRLGDDRHRDLHAVVAQRQDGDHLAPADSRRSR